MKLKRFWSRKGPMILVVDDVQDIRKMLEDILRHNGYSVVSAGDGDAALQAAQTKDPVIILLDIMMPIIDGLTTLRFLKANVKTKDIPVIMLTGLQQGKDVEEAFSKGAAGYLIKPFTADRLLAKIEEVRKAKKA